MPSITLALSTDGSPVPGIDCALAPGLFVTHAVPVRDWIMRQRAAVGNHGVIVIADDEWTDPGDGGASLTVPASQADIDELHAIRERLARETGRDDAG